MAGFSYLVLLGDFMKQVIHFANSIMGDVHAVPAYGRDYRSMAAVKAAWAEGKDFFDSYSRRYLSVRDDVRGQVWVRYSRLQKIIRVQ